MQVDQFFKDHPYITAIGVSKKSGVHYQSLRLEIKGKYSDAERIKCIEQAIHAMGRELLNVKLDLPV